MKKTVKISFIVLMVLLSQLFILPYAFSVTEFENKEDYKPFAESKFTTINGVRIHFREWNSGKDSVKGNILLIHGFSGSTFSWRRNIDTLVKEGYHVVAADVPPFGYSTKQKKINHSTSANAMVLWKLSDSLNSGKWIIAGHSMGASIAGAMAAMHPDKTNKLILVDGTFEGTEMSDKIGFKNWLISSNPVKGLAEIIGKSYFHNYKKFKKLLASAYSQEPDSMSVLGYMQPFQQKRITSAILESVRSHEIQTLLLSGIKAPVLVIWGSKDTWIPIEAGNNFMEKYPAATFKVINGAGHCSMETHPGVFNKLFSEFISNDSVH